MSKVVEFLEDVYPFGCRGDVKRLADDVIAEVDKVAKKHKLAQAYKDVTQKVEQAVNTKKASDTGKSRDDAGDESADSKPATSKK